MRSFQRWNQWHIYTFKFYNWSFTTLVTRRVNNHKYYFFFDKIYSDLTFILWFIFTFIIWIIIKFLFVIGVVSKNFLMSIENYLKFN
jgi:hypothetical protein